MPKNKSEALLNGSGRRYATIQETADYLRISERTVRLKIESRELRAYRLGKQIIRLDLNEVDDVMAGK